jgi:hypothetical protein
MLAPLNLGVLVEEGGAGSAAGRGLVGELERVLREVGGLLEVVGRGLQVLEEKGRGGIAVGEAEK